jgi:hypothetical protein
MRKMKEPCRAEDYEDKPKLMVISVKKDKLALINTKVILE